MRRLFRITSSGSLDTNRVVIADKVHDYDLHWIVKGFFKEYDIVNQSITITAMPTEMENEDE